MRNNKLVYISMITGLLLFVIFVLTLMILINENEENIRDSIIQFKGFNE